jgi:hypothetical protein
MENTIIQYYSKSCVPMAKKEALTLNPNSLGLQISRCKEDRVHDMRIEVTLISSPNISNGAKLLARSGHSCHPTKILDIGGFFKVQCKDENP